MALVSLKKKDIDMHKLIETLEIIQHNLESVTKSLMTAPDLGE